jgi:hypothetical protein
VGKKLVRTKSRLGLLGSAIALPRSGWAADEAAAPGLDTPDPEVVAQSLSGQGSEAA